MHFIIIIYSSTWVPTMHVYSTRSLYFTPERKRIASYRKLEEYSGVKGRSFSLGLVCLTRLCCGNSPHICSFCLYWTHTNPRCRIGSLVQMDFLHSRFTLPTYTPQPSTRYVCTPNKSSDDVFPSINTCRKPLAVVVLECRDNEGKCLLQRVS